jgi:hypothetical protein
MPGVAFYAVQGMCQNARTRRCYIMRKLIKWACTAHAYALRITFIQTAAHACTLYRVLVVQEATAYVFLVACIC